MDPYRELGVARGASDREIKRAFHRLALLHHPDKLPPSATPEERTASEERFKRVAGAWEILSDPAKRKAFDSGRGGGGAYRDSRDVFREFFGGAADGPSHPAADGDAAPIRIEPCWPEDIFNLPLFEGYLVLDPRPPETREQSGTSVFTSIPAASALHAGWETWATEAADHFTHERKDVVVILGDSGAEVLAESLAGYLSGSEPPTTLDPPAGSLGCPTWGPHDTAIHVLNGLRRRCKLIWVVRGGTPGVLGSFPVLAGDWGPALPTPTHVAPGVLLGSRVVPWEKRHLVDGLGVTHAIVAADQAQGLAELDGVSVITVETTDSDDADMASVWSQAVAAIDAVVAEGGRVLIWLYGRSRSASVALAWMCRAHNLPVKMAAELLRQRTGDRVDWRLAYPEQIIEWLEQERLQAPS